MSFKANFKCSCNSNLSSYPRLTTTNNDDSLVLLKDRPLSRVLNSKKNHSLKNSHGLSGAVLHSGGVFMYSKLAQSGIAAVSYLAGISTEERLAGSAEIAESRESSRVLIAKVLMLLLWWRWEQSYSIQVEST